MHAFSNESDTSEVFFAQLYENRPSKIFIVTLSAVMAPINVVLLYSIIWYEHYGVDLKRTIMNKSISSLCWTGMVFETGLFAVNFWRFTVGPPSYTVCLVRTTLLYTCSLTTLLFIDLNLVGRYLYVFVLKNPFALQDDFWSLYMNMVITGFAFISQAVHMFLPGKLPLEFHLCLSSDPDEGNPVPRRNIATVIVFIVTLVLNIVVPIRMRLYQLKYKKNERITTFVHNMTDLTTTTAIIISCSILFASLLVQYTFQPARLNLYPNYIYVQLFQMIVPRVVVLVVVCFYYIRNRTLRLTIWRSLKEDFPFLDRQIL